MVRAAAGDLGETDLALLKSAQRSRLLLALTAVLDADVPTGQRWPGVPPTRPGTAWALLAAVQRADPQAVEAVLCDPAVGAWVFRLLRRLVDGAVAVPPDAPLWAGATLLGSLAAAAAIRSGTRCSLRVPAHRGQLWLPSLGLAGTVGRGEWAVVGVECGPSGAVVFGDGGSVQMPRDLSAPAEGWSPLPRLDVAGADGTAAAVLDHLSPYRDFRSLRAPAELSPPEVRRWQCLVARTGELLREDHPAAYRTVADTLRSLVPVDSPSTLRVVSASVPDAHGAVTMSLPLDPQACAATLVHETWHQLLTAVGNLTPLFVPVRDGPEPVYFAPWRDDPRPLRGLLYGAHAFAGLTSFWRHRRTMDGERADFEFALHRWQLRTALAALRNATGLTEAGGHVVATLAGLSRDSWTEPVHGPPRHVAGLCCADLWASWRAAHLAVDGEEADMLADRLLTGRSPTDPLPAARLASSRPIPRGGNRMWLARLMFTDRKSFERARSDLDAGAEGLPGIPGATAADALLVSGDARGAMDLYRAAAPGAAAWIGIGLAGEWPATPLVERPELVLALYTALVRRGVRPPGPEALAEWLGPVDVGRTETVTRSADRCRSWPV